jgi:hypothetical protein
MAGIYSSLYWGLNDSIGVKGAIMALIIAVALIAVVRYLKWNNQ